MTNDDRLDPKDAARDQLVHGLLRGLHEDDATEQARVARALAELNVDPARVPAVSSPRRSFAFAAAAAALVVIGVASFLVSDGDPARVLVGLAAHASVTDGDQRYRMSVVVTAVPDVRLEATVDTRGADRAVLRLESPLGFAAALVRSPAGMWVVHDSAGGGTIVTAGGEDGSLPWLRIERSAVPLWGAVEVLAALSDGYALELAGEDEATGLRHVVALREVDDDARPERVDLRIDATAVVLRLELTWPSAPATHAPGAPRPRGGPELLARAPRFAAGLLLPPRRVVLERLAKPSLPADWYQPETHAR